jgi:hypothetical protein
MLDGSFFGKNGGRAASGVAACVASAAWKKKFIFFLSSFPERMFREVNGDSFVSSTLRGTGKRMDSIDGV